MKSLKGKFVPLAVALVFGLATLRPACTANADCPMPCCSKSGSHAGSGAGVGAGCCPSPEPPQRQIGDGCAAAPRDFDAHLVFAGPVVADAGASPYGPTAPCASEALGPRTFAGLAPVAKMPLYLRVHTLLI